MKSKDRSSILISAIILAFFWLIYLVKSVLTPFVISLILAYFLNPLVNRLAMKYKTSRLCATSIIMIVFLLFFIGTCVVLLPILYSQLIALLNSMPHYLQTISTEFYPKIATQLNELGFNLENDFSQMVQNHNLLSRLGILSQSIAENILNSSIAIINIFSLIFITPVLVFYLLKDWNIMLNKAHGYLPSHISSAVDQIFKKIDNVLSGYVRGQFNVCLILGLIYSILLSIAGLNFGFLIGFLTGLFSFVPYVGMIVGVTFAIIVALFQWGLDSSHLLIIASVFIFGQIVESNFLTPKLLSDKIGLHPFWLIFGLFVFGALFGFIGVIIAVPLTAICGVLARFFAMKYKQKINHAK